MNIKEMVSNTLGLSNELNQYIRVGIGEARSKEEEDRLVSEDVERLRQEIAKPSLPERKVWEIILRVIYAEMLGHSTEFAHAFVVNSLQSTNYRVKRVAYVACALLLEEESPFRIMVVASVQKDLQNPCLYNKVIALNCLPKLLCPLNASAFVEPLLRQLTNPQPVVRKKAIIAAVRLERLLPGAVERFDEQVEKCIRDADPAVVLAAIPFYRREAERDPDRLRPLFDVFLRVLQQLLERRLPKDYEYDGHSAPWAAAQLLQLLGLLARGDRALSEKLAPSLEAVLRGLYALLTDGDASLVFQATLTALQIVPRPELTALCAEKLDLLLRSAALKRPDRLYLALRLIARLVEVGPALAAEHQLLLLECLDAPDEALRQLAAEVLLRAASAESLDRVAPRINALVASASDPQLRRQTAERLFAALEARAPSPQWFLQRALELFAHGPECVPLRLLHSLLVALREAVQFDETSRLVPELLSVFQDCLQRLPLNDLLASAFGWFLGSFGHALGSGPDLERFLLDSFSFLLSQSLERTETLGIVFSALAKLKSRIRSPSFSASVDSLLAEHRPKSFGNLSVRAGEYLRAQDASLWETSTQPDCSLSFLEAFVRKQVFKGGKLYNPEAKLALAKSVPEDQGSQLRTHYSKEQIDQNMRKLIPSQEGEFRYGGRGRWGGNFGQGESAKSQQAKKEANDYVGLSSDDVGALEVQARARKQADGAQVKRDSAKSEANPQLEARAFGVKPKRERKGKKTTNRGQIAHSLFGPTEDLFAHSTSGKQGFFKLNSNAEREKSALPKKEGQEEISSAPKLKTSGQNQSNHPNFL